MGFLTGELAGLNSGGNVTPHLLGLLTADSFGSIALLVSGLAPQSFFHGFQFLAGFLFGEFSCFHCGNNFPFHSLILGLARVAVGALCVIRLGVVSMCLFAFKGRQLFHGFLLGNFAGLSGCPNLAFHRLSLGALRFARALLAVGFFLFALIRLSSE